MPLWYGGGEEIDDPEAVDAREEVEPALCIVCSAMSREWEDAERVTVDYDAAKAPGRGF